MDIYNLTLNKTEKDLSSYQAQVEKNKISPAPTPTCRNAPSPSSTSPIVDATDAVDADINNYFIVVTIDELNELDELTSQIDFNFSPYQKEIITNSKINFESFIDLDFLSFLYYNLQDNNFIFEKLVLLRQSNLIILIVEEKGQLHKSFLSYFFNNILVHFPANYSLSFFYYNMLNYAFATMFGDLEEYENYLSKIEDEILIQKEDFDLKSIVKIKNACFSLKKHHRQLLYVGDQILLNENIFFADNDKRYLNNIDAHINKLYEFTATLQDFSNHLMDLYDSNVTSNTNDLMNKLTIFTVFGVPATVITGVYGISYVKGPISKYPSDYIFPIILIVVSLLITYYFLKRNKFL